MMRSHGLRLSALVALLLLLSTAVFAQSTDRSQLVKEIDALRAQLKEKEQMLLSPVREDREAFGEALQQPGTGLVRLLPRGKYQLYVRGDGAYYSFTRLTHEYGYGSDIGLEQGMLQVGFAGADFGFLVRVGDVPIDSLSLDHPGAQFLSNFNTPSLETEARGQQRRAGQGFEQDGFTYSNRVAASVNTTYLLRSVNYRESDVLVAFRVVRKDRDGSLILLWKMLRRFPAPQLAQNREQ
jgi:hypothetical protein